MIRALCSPFQLPLGRSWLFWITLLFGAFLAFYTPWKFWLEAEKRVAVGHVDPIAIGFGSVAVVAAFTGIRWCILLVFSYGSIVRGERAPMIPDDAPLPFVSILVPAYAEAECIGDALEALTHLDYRAYEVIVVDDGSSDDTYELALPFAGRHARSTGTCDVRVYRKPNGGKWSAHNFAFRRARGSLILCIDADSRIEADSLRLMVRHMGDLRVGGVSGQIRVRNRTSLLMHFQALEYILANGALRLSQGAVGSVTIVPGPIGMFRREVMAEILDRFEAGAHPELTWSAIGPFSHRTFAEDFNLSLSVLALGYHILYEPHAIAHTKAPASIPSLMSQRYRWNRGTMQVLNWYVRQALRGGEQQASLNIWICVAFMLDYYLFPIIYFSLLGGMVGYMIHGGSLSNILFWAIAGWMANVMSGTLYALAHRDRLSLLLLVPIFEPYQGILLNSAWLIAAFDQLRGARMRW